MIPNGIDPGYLRGFFEGAQGVQKDGRSQKVDKLFGPAHPAPGTAGQHERHDRHGRGEFMLRHAWGYLALSFSAPSTILSASEISTSRTRAISEVRIWRAFISMVRSPVERPCSPP